jgi:hypothetical protein
MGEIFFLLFPFFRTSLKPRVLLFAFLSARFFTKSAAAKALSVAPSPRAANASACIFFCAEVENDELRRRNLVLPTTFAAEGLMDAADAAAARSIPPNAFSDLRAII